MDMSSNMTFAPTEKLSASLVITKASKLSPGPLDLSDCVTRPTMSPPNAFILEWNSMQATPSPRSTRERHQVYRSSGDCLQVQATYEAVRSHPRCSLPYRGQGTGAS